MKLGTALILSLLAVAAGSNADDLAARSLAMHAAAIKQATLNHFPTSGLTSEGERFQLVAAENGRLIYYNALTSRAAISTNATAVRATAPYNLTGLGVSVGIWDAGAIRFSHEALFPRATNADGYSVIDPVGTAHATSVAGVIGASSVAPLAYEGMAPSATILGFFFDYDQVEMNAFGASVANEPGKITLSNHAYGITSGWELGTYSGNSGYHFFGTWSALPQAESDNFGEYLQDAVNLDQICYDKPYYLPIISAGNDRDDTAPAVGTPFYYYTYDGVNYTWHLQPSYDPAIHPLADAIANGGFDTIQPYAGSKNTLCVGSVDDAVSGSTRDISLASMVAYSGWGPTDDGRVKPDVVGNGAGLFGLRALADSGATAYRAAADLNGTSFSAPNVTGSAALLTELYANLFPGQMMRSSTMKALIIHTADDLTDAVAVGDPAARVGPDYSTGWGLMNTQAAADLLRDQALNSTHLRILETGLGPSNNTRSHNFTYGGSGVVKVTLCWTDPAGIARTQLDDRSPVLLNDLDLRITDSTATIFYPWILDVENPANAATTGDNVVDNVEQVLIDLPAAGTYTVTVSHKGALSGGIQDYALAITGLTDNEVANLSDWNAPSQ